MNGPDGGAEIPHHTSRPRPSTSKSPVPHSGKHHKRKKSHGPPLEHRLANVVDLQDPSRLLEGSQIERQLRFQHLVRRYISQILCGCKFSHCTTPTCLSCTKRLASRPFRAPTQLTARALAHYLATQDNPCKALCPHELKIPPDALEIEGATGIQVRQGKDGTNQQCSVYPTPWTLAQLQPNKVVARDGEKAGSAEAIALLDRDNRGAVMEKVMQSVATRHQTRKDLKSLGQNLYDTATILYSFSKQIPSSLSVLASLRSPNGNVHNVEVPGSNPPPAANTSINVARAPFTGHINSHCGEAHIHGHSRITKQHSQQNLRSLNKPTTIQITSETLSNGQRVHKIPFHPSSQGYTPNSLDPTPVDGTLELSAPPVSKMAKKFSSLNIGKGHKVALNAPTTTTAGSIKNDKQPADSTAPILPVASHLNCDILDEMKDEVFSHRAQQSSDFNYVVDYDPNTKFRPAKPFVNRSLFYALSDVDTLLQSFRNKKTESFKDSPLPHLDSYHLAHAFRDWNRRNGALIFDSLWVALEALFIPPPELDLQKSPRLKPSRKNASPGESFEQSSNRQNHPITRYLSSEQAAHIVMICIHALSSLVPVGWPHTWTQLRKLRSWGIIVPHAPPGTDEFTHPWLSIVDELEYEPAVRLADRLLQAIGARTCFEHILASINGGEAHQESSSSSLETLTLVEILVKHLQVVESAALAAKRKMKINQKTQEDPGWTVTATFMEWMRTIIIKKWDSKPLVNKWSSVGTSIILFDKFNTNRDALNLRPGMFEMPFLHEHIDAVGEPSSFLRWEEQPNTFHILQYPCLFPPTYLVAYFRTISLTSMLRHYEHTGRTAQLQRAMDMFLREPFWWLIRNRLKVTLSDYLVLDVSREDSLKDTLNQLWGQEKQLLLKPLKVKMGMQEGEVGLDHGGVTYEFFRVVLNEAFNPDNGMFTIDPQSRMIWFRPGSLEPDWKFEMLGVLFSLAVYNGITLPVTFPLALYHALLGSDHPHLELDTSKIDFIRDGWPALAKAFDQLLSWSDGDVADVMMRDYAFSYEAFGKRIDVNMQTLQEADPSEHLAFDLSKLKVSDDPELVTNANREQFVRDYIYWLTYRSVAPQIEAFRKGFYTCLQAKALHLFTPTSLRRLVEGTQDIPINELRAATRYEDGYTASHTTILDFWSIVEKYSQEDRRRLLEFVTASDRVPVTGLQSINFAIVKAGSDTDMLPTSSTCFGKLMLPAYGSREKMQKKLDLAIRNAKGFGVV